MKKLLIVIVLLSCLVMSGCQKDELNAYKVEMSKQNQKIEELALKVAELSEENTTLKEEKESLEKEIEDLKNDLLEYGLIKHPIELEYEKEMESWNGNTAEGVEISTKYGEQWEAEMKKYYDLLYKELDEDKKKWLISSQEKWEEFTKENEELMWQLNDQNHHGGTIMYIISANIYYERYRDRALFLKEEYEILTAVY